MIKSWKTTLLGIACALLAGYLQSQRGELNSSNAMADLAIAGLGIAAKDHDK